MAMNSKILLTRVHPWFVVGFFLCQKITEILLKVALNTTPLLWGGLHYLIDLIFGVLTPLSAILQLYHGDQF
jgi:hypothetical protein